MAVLDDLRARNRFDVELESGSKVTLQLPDLLDCMIAVSIPMPVIKHVRELERKARRATENGHALSAEDAEDELNLDELGELRRANMEAVRRAVKMIDGQEVELTPQDVQDCFTPQQREELLNYINNRELTIPKAGALE